MKQSEEESRGKPISYVQEVCMEQQGIALPVSGWVGVLLLFLQDTELWTRTTLEEDTPSHPGVQMMEPSILGVTQRQNGNRIRLQTPRSYTVSLLSQQGQVFATNWQ